MEVHIRNLANLRFRIATHFRQVFHALYISCRFCCDFFVQLFVFSFSSSLSKDRFVSQQDFLFLLACEIPLCTCSFNKKQQMGVRARLVSSRSKGPASENQLILSFWCKSISLILSEISLVIRRSKSLIQKRVFLRAISQNNKSKFRKSLTSNPSYTTHRRCDLLDFYLRFNLGILLSETY